MSLAALLLIILALLCTTNLCSGSRVKTFNEVALAFRQEETCDSELDCREGEKCLSFFGICSGSDCKGICSDQPSSGQPSSGQPSSDQLPCSCEEPCSRYYVCVQGTGTSVEEQWCLHHFLVGAFSYFVKPIDCPSETNEAEESVSSGGSGNGDEEDNPSGGTDDGVCIGVDMLSNFEPHELVFKRHLLARVLCDSAGSCATKGHIVSYMGKSMMMVNYCSIVGCKELVMEVNSPRYQVGLKVKSRSEGMYFTAFAARYETSAEEAVLGAAVRLGF